MFQRLNLKYDKLLSSFAFDCNLRHYIMGQFLQTQIDSKAAAKRMEVETSRRFDALQLSSALAADQQEKAG